MSKKRGKFLQSPIASPGKTQNKQVHPSQSCWPLNPRAKPSIIPIRTKGYSFYFPNLRLIPVIWAMHLTPSRDIVPHVSISLTPSLISRNRVSKNAVTMLINRFENPQRPYSSILESTTSSSPLTDLAMMTFVDGAASVAGERDRSWSETSVVAQPLLLALGYDIQERLCRSTCSSSSGGQGLGIDPSGFLLGCACLFVSSSLPWPTVARTRWSCGTKSGAVPRQCRTRGPCP